MPRGGGEAAHPRDGKARTKITYATFNVKTGARRGTHPARKSEQTLIHAPRRAQAAGARRRPESRCAAGTRPRPLGPRPPRAPGAGGSRCPSAAASSGRRAEAAPSALRSRRRRRSAEPLAGAAPRRAPPPAARRREPAEAGAGGAQPGLWAARSGAAPQSRSPAELGGLTRPR